MRFLSGYRADSVYIMRKVVVRARVALMVALFVGLVSPTFADELECGSLQNAFGPFDYRDKTKGQELQLVESGHFTADVRTLRRGASTVSPIDDLNYALRAFPNHWGALEAVSRFELQGGNMREFRTVDCYFDRALRFAPDDSNVHLLYGVYLMRRKRDDEARRELEEAERLAPESIDIAYNLGLLYLRLGEPGKSMEKARYAYEKGYPLPGLRVALEKAGAWKP